MCIRDRSIIYKNLNWSNFFKIIERGAISSSVIFILLAMGSVLSFFITIIQVPDILKDFLINIDAGMITFLLVVNIAFFLAYRAARALDQRRQHRAKRREPAVLVGAYPAEAGRLGE